MSPLQKLHPILQNMEVRSFANDSHRVQMDLYLSGLRLSRVIVNGAFQWKVDEPITLRFDSILESTVVLLIAGTLATTVTECTRVFTIVHEGEPGGYKSIRKFTTEGLLGLQWSNCPSSTPLVGFVAPRSRTHLSYVPVLSRKPSSSAASVQ
ncbi:hypothetical protein CBL_11364 [Carabus blaptoides fortunei]